MNKRILSSVLAGLLITSTAPTVLASEITAPEITPIIGELDYKSAAYELYVNDNIVQLADEDNDTDKDTGDKEEKPLPSENPDVTENPDATEVLTPQPACEPPKDFPLEWEYPTYNSAAQGYVTSVKNQVENGDCWAYAATSVFETSLLKSGIVTDAKTLDLSEKHLTDNTYKIPENPWSFDYTTMGHSGVTTSYLTRGTGPVYDNGNGDDVSSYDTSKYGVNTDLQSEFYVDSIVNIPDVDLIAIPVTEETNISENYGYTVFDGYVITNPEDLTNEVKNNSYVMRNQAGYDLYRVGFNEQKKAIKQKILEEGSVYTTMSTRVADTEKDENDMRNFDYFFNYETNAFYNYLFTEADHAVTIVGWDDSYSKENFVNPPEYDGAWIIKNSWGNDQLDNGYMYVSYYDTKICIDVISISAAKKKNMNKIFQHDEFGTNATLSFDVSKHTEEGRKSELWALNRFENEKTEGEFLTKVGVFTTEANTTCNIYISSNEENTADNVGGKTTYNTDGFRNDEPIKTATFEYPGYYIIELGNPVEIWGDFEVAVRYEFKKTENANIVTMPIEMSAPEQNASNAGSTNPGESYYAIDHGTGFKFIWCDMYNAETAATTENYKTNNACIKAFTIIKGDDEKHTVSDFEVMDMNGKVIESLPTTGNFFANVTVTKDKNRLENDYLIISSYDENGALLSFSYMLVEPSMEIGDKRTLGTMINVPADKKLGCIKAFVWNDLSNATPVSNVIELKAETAPVE